MFCKLEHVIVCCSEMKRSVAFYRDVLGFPVKLESPEWTEFHCGGVMLALRLAAPSEKEKPEKEKKKKEKDAEQRQRDPGRAGEARLGFEVLDLEKFYQEKMERGAVFSLAPTATDSGRKQAVLLDPDGLPISVTEEIR